MPDHDDEVSETEELAGEINASIASFNETIGCLLQGGMFTGAIDPLGDLNG